MSPFWLTRVGLRPTEKAAFTSVVRTVRCTASWLQEAPADPTRFHFWGLSKNLIGRWGLRDISVLAE